MHRYVESLEKQEESLKRKICEIESALKEINSKKSKSYYYIHHPWFQYLYSLFHTDVLEIIDEYIVMGICQKNDICQKNHTYVKNFECLECVDFDKTKVNIYPMFPIDLKVSSNLVPFCESKISRKKLYKELNQLIVCEDLEILNYIIHHLYASFKKVNFKFKSVYKKQDVHVSLEHKKDHEIENQRGYAKYVNALKITIVQENYKISFLGYN